MLDIHGPTPVSVSGRVSLCLSIRPVMNASPRDALLLGLLLVFNATPMEISLLFSPESPPLSVIVAARISEVAILPDPSLPPASDPVFVFSSGYYDAFFLFSFDGFLVDFVGVLVLI